MRHAPSRLLLSVFVSAGLFACGGDDMDPSPTLGDEPSMAGAPAGVAGAPETEDGPAELNGCKASAYEDASAKEAERVVQIGADGLVFTPRCITIAIGQTVTFEGSLAAHPLAPGNASDTAAGSPGNPIVQTRSGSSVEFTFDSAGTYPYFCELHGFGDGKGMSGAVFVRAEQ